MKFFSRIKRWFKRTFGGGGSSSRSSSRASRVSNYGGGGSRSYRDYSSGGYRRDYQDRQEAERRRRQEQKRKQEATTKALASISKRTDALSSGRSPSVAGSATHANSGGGTVRVLSKINQKSKATPPDPKVKAAQASRERATKMLAKIESDRKSYNKATGNKYNPEVGTKAERQRARQRIKAGEYQSDPNAEKWEVKHHPKAASATRGALSGVTFGGSELVAQRSKRRKETGTEQYYQKHKSRGAEIGGEIVGSLIGFGMTEKGATKLASKLAPRVLKEGGENVARKLATNTAFRKAAIKEAEKAGMKLTDDVIERFALQRARRVVGAVGRDMAINWTTGGLMDVNMALRDTYEKNDGKFDKGDFAKSLATNRAINYGLGGLLTVAPALRTTKGILRRGAREDALELAKNITNERGMRQSMLDAFVGDGKNAGKRIDMNALLERNIKDSTDALSPVKMSSKADDMARMRKAMNDAFVRDADEARRIDMNEALAQNSPFRQADDALQVAQTDARQAIDTSPEAIQEEAAQAVREDVIRNNPELAKGEPRVTQETKATPPRQEGDVSQFKGVDDDIPTNDIKTVRQNDAKANLEAEAERMANEKPRTDETAEIKIRNAADDKALSKNVPQGVTTARSAYEWNNGEKVEGSVRTTWDEAWNAAKEYAQSQGSGVKNRKSKVSVSQINAMDSDAERELRQKLADEGLLNYDVIHTEELYDKVSKQMRDDPDRWVKEMIDINEGGALDFRATPEWQARVQYIMATVDPSADPASEIAYTEAFKLAKDISSKGGQTLNLRRNFVHLTEAGKRDSAVEDLAKILYKSKAFVKNHAKELNGKGYYDRINYIKGFLMENDKIKDGVEQLVKANNPDAVSDAYSELILNLNKQNPKSGFDFVQEIRYLNMLGNPKTHIRNIFGSGLFSPVRQISNAIRAGVEDRFAKQTGLEITKHGGLSFEALREARTKSPETEAGKKALEAFNNLKTDILGSAKYDTQTYTGRSKTAFGKAVDFLSDKNSALLAKEDDFFKQRAFRENYIKSYNKYKSRGIITPKIERKIEAEAMQEAQIATFNEFNDLANFLGRISSKAYDANASTLEKGGGILMNAVMPFTKVPSNIMKQSMNYSPIGIARGLSNIKKAAQTGSADLLNKAIDQYASGLTGTGIMALGAFAGLATDWFTTNAGKNDYAAKFKKQEGVQNYSVMVNLGKKKYSVTLDWLVPTSSTFFMGVELANQIKAGDFDILDFGGDWAQISTRLFEPVLESSMLSGLYSMLESTRNNYGDDDTVSALHIMFRETVQGYLNSLVPTVVGQAARTAYKSDLQITGEDDWEYWRNQMKSKAGLGETNIFGEALGADTTAYGDVKGDKGKSFKQAVADRDTEALGKYGVSALKNFISPANIQKVDLDEVDREKIKQYEDAVKNGADPQDMAYLFPKKQYKKQFTTGNLDVQMSNRDLSTYNHAKTTGGAEGARYALESIMFNRYTKDENGKKHSTADAYTPEQKAEIIRQFEGKSIRDVEKWVREQPQFKNSTEAEQRKVIDGLWSYSKQGKAQSAKRAGEQAVIEAQGGDVNEYNFNNEITEKKREALQPLIDNGTITYEEAVDFARFAGKTYYYEDDEGGHSQTYYNKGVMMDYLKSKGYSDEKCAALFNAFKASNAKEYGSSSGRRRRRGYRRRGWRHYGHGGSSKKATVPTPKAIKANQLVQGEALVSKKSGSSSASTPKVTPPTLKRVQAKIDLPNARTRKEY